MRGLAYLLAAMACASVARAHAHHAAAEIDTSVPFDPLIWIHMTVQATVWTISFPLGVVLGLSKYHVPLQIINVALTYAAAYLGHHHKGRQFPATVHGIMAKLLVWTMIAQAVLGVFLKLHIFESSLFRRAIKVGHRYVGVVFPFMGYLQMMFGITTALDLCRDQTLGQCVSHYTAGSAFLGYALLMMVLVQTGGAALGGRAWGVGREMMDGVFMAVAGVMTVALGSYQPGQIHTIDVGSMSNLTGDDGLHSHADGRSIYVRGSLRYLMSRHEHHAAPAETEQAAPVGWAHIIVGLAWLVGGTLGAFLSTKGNKSFIPSVIVTMTGLGIAIGSYISHLASAVHLLLGASMALFGLLRIVQICFFDRDTLASPGAFTHLSKTPPGDATYPVAEREESVVEAVVQHLQNFTLVVAGAAFMFSTQQSVHKAEAANIPSWSYILLNLALSLALYGIIAFLAYMYRNTGQVGSGGLADVGLTGGGGGVERGHGHAGRASGIGGEYVPLVVTHAAGEDRGQVEELFDLGEGSDDEDEERGIAGEAGSNDTRSEAGWTVQDAQRIGPGRRVGTP